MESLQQIKLRIASIAGTRQITQSMRLVSSAKVQKTRNRMEQNRAFRGSAIALVRNVASAMQGTRNPYLDESVMAGRDAAVIVLSGDRGLCGGYHVNVQKEALALLKRLGGSARVITVGAKARDGLKRRLKGSVVQSHTGISETPYFQDVEAIAQEVLDWYRTGEVGQVHLVYTEFETMLSHIPRTMRLLPLEPPETALQPGRCEPGEEELLAKVMPFYLTTVIYGAMLEASTCEQSARVSSMDTAVKNADEMIALLERTYNRARQGRITQEIIEIVGGASAV